MTFNVSGWVKLHRQIRSQEIYSESKLLHVYLDLLLSANFAPGDLDNGMHLNTGECVISQQFTSALLRMSRESFRNKLNKLVTMGLIKKRVLGGRKGTLVTLLKYKQLQDHLIEPETGQHRLDRPAELPANLSQNKKVRSKEEKKQRVCFDSLKYPSHLSSKKVRRSVVKWAKHRGHSLSTEQLQSLINANEHRSALYFCRSIEHSIASGWKSVNPAPDDKMLVKHPPITKPQKSEKERRLDCLDSQLHTVMAKLKTAIGSEKHALLKEKERLIALRDRLEASK